jgi:hypothetical protein
MNEKTINNSKKTARDEKTKQQVNSKTRKQQDKNSTREDNN